MRTVSYALCLFLTAGLGLGSVSAVADTLLVPDHPQQYVVRKGDTLWDISAKFLTKPWRWPELWEINKHIENPHLIYPGDLLRVVDDGGKQYLELVRGGGVPQDGAMAGTGAGSDSGTATADGSSAVSAGGTAVASREVRLSPEIKVFPRAATPISTVPLERVHAFLRHARGSRCQRV